MFYRCAAFSRWEFSEAINAIRLSAGSLYYDETGSGESNSSGEAGDEDENCDAARSPAPVEISRSRRAEARASRHESDPDLKRLEQVMDVVIFLWPWSCPQKPPSTEEDMRQDRVHAWLQLSDSLSWISF